MPTDGKRRTLCECDSVRMLSDSSLLAFLDVFAFNLGLKSMRLVFSLDLKANPWYTTRDKKM